MVIVAFVRVAASAYDDACNQVGRGGIAKQLFVSESTAKTHISKLYEKLGAANRAQALMTALRLGLLEAPDAPKF